jgi:signal transduction histidine kinase
MVKKPGRSIFTTQTASYLLIILVLSATFSIFFFSTAKGHLEKQVGGKLADIARIAARNTPFARLDLIKVGDDETRMVLRLKEKLGEIQEASSVENIIIFGKDQRTLLDLRPHRLIGSTYNPPRFDKSFTHDLGRGDAVSTDSYRSPSGKFFISAFAPVMDAEGGLFAVVGVDGGAAEVGIIEQMRTRLYWIAGLSVVFAFILALFLARRLTRPIRGIAETAGRIGRGDYQARVPLPPTAELRVLADSINSMAQQVQERDKQLKEMSASVAHEIRNPLNSLKLQLTLLGEELGDVTGGPPPKTLDTLHYEIGKLNRFLTEFLTYSRPMTLIRNAVAPGDLVQATLEMAMAAAEEKGVEINIISETDLPTIHADRDRLEQSLLNILLNAVQACVAGGKVEMKIKRSKDGNDVVFLVEDTGPGIPEDVMEHLFEPFFTTKETGTGLGLSNTQRIVFSHGGKISAENLAHRGARFTITIPISTSTTQRD